MLNSKLKSEISHRFIIFSAVLAFCLITVYHSSTLIFLTNILRPAHQVSNAQISKDLTDDDTKGFNSSFIFRPVNGNGVFSYYNVCIEERQPAVSRSLPWGFGGFQNETQRIVIYRGISGQHNDTPERRDISVASPRTWMWKHWELYFTNASIPRSHKLHPTTAFFISESIVNNIYHAWNDIFHRLYYVVRDANRLHPGMRNQILYRNTLLPLNSGDPVCKFCRRSTYDIFFETLQTTSKIFLFYELPTNTCFSSAVFGTRYSGRRIRESIEHVLQELKLSHKPLTKDKSILLVQRQYRRILNIDNLAQEARRIGFKNVTVVDLEQMSVLEQMAAMMSTDILIGVHGAALQWGIFMRPGSILIEISWPKKHWPSCYSFVGSYGIKFLRLETTDVVVNWEYYETRWPRVNSTEERARMIRTRPRTGHGQDNIWKYADVTVNVKQFENILTKLL